MRPLSFHLVSATAVADGVELYSCKTMSFVEMNGDKLPDTVQLFPPGAHDIVARKDGKPAALKVKVDANVAAMIASEVKEMIAAADRGEGPKPFLDFNHEDRDAAAWVTDIVWAGEDPKTGGVRAKVEWTTPGAAALQGKSFRQFSPNFRVDKDSGAIVGTTANMGGLVNRPAFRRIQPFFASEPGGAQGGDGNNNPKAKDMNKLHQALVAAGLLSSIPTDEAAACIEFNGTWGKVQAKVADGATLQTKFDAQKKVLDDTTTERDTYKAKADTAAKANAETVVAGWVKDGIIAAKDDAGIKHWTETLTKDPTASKLMEPVISAKAAAGGANNDPTKKVIQNGNAQGNGQGGGNGAKADDKAAMFSAKAEEIRKEKKCSKGDALVEAAAQDPDGYNAYRQNLLYVDPKAGN